MRKITSVWARAVMDRKRFVSWYYCQHHLIPHNPTWSHHKSLITLTLIAGKWRKKNLTPLCPISPFPFAMNSKTSQRPVELEIKYIFLKFCNNVLRFNNLDVKEKVNSTLVVWDSPNYLKDHLLCYNELNDLLNTHTPWLQTEQRHGIRHPHAVYHPVPLHLLSIWHVSWGTAAMTFDPEIKEQERGYQYWSFSSNGHTEAPTQNMD